MARFEQAIPIILRHEGGFVNHPSDPGGATNFGVSLRYLKTLGHVGDFDSDGDVDADDIRKMTREDAERIYRQQWWDKQGYDRIEDQLVATKIFDMAVNMGAAQAHKLAQRALGVAVDGILGPKTLAAINAANPVVLYKSLQRQQANFYRELAASNPKFSVFLAGWFRRAYASSA